MKFTRSYLPVVNDDSVNVNNAANRTYRKMTEDPVASLVVKLGIPTMLSMLVTALYSTASTYYVSYLGTSAVGAMGVNFALQTVIQAIGIMIGQGCASQTSRLLGAKNYVRANALASSGLFLSLVFSAVFALFAIIGLKSLLRAMGATDTILPYAKDYASIILLAAPFMAASYTLNNLLRSEGLAIVGMMGLGFGGVLNIAVCPIFIFVFDWGIQGAACATAICQMISFVILLSHYLRGKGSMKMHWAFISKEFSLYGSIFKNGLPSLTRNSLGAVAASVLNLMAGRYGDAGVAAMSIVGQVMMITNAFLIGLGQGFQPVCGFNFGAKRYDRVLESFWFCVKVAVVLLTTLAVISFFGAGTIMAQFRKDDPAVIEIGTWAMRFQCLTLPFQSWIIMSNMLTQTIGYGFRASIVAAGRQGIFLFPVLLSLPGLMGVRGLQLCQPAADICTFIAAMVIVLGVLKELREKNEKMQVSEKKL